MNSNNKIKQMQEDIDQINQWVDDLQSKMYVNCVYCGHNFGQEDAVNESMRDALQKHMEKCPKHPMATLKKRNEKLEYFKQEVSEMVKAMKDTCGEGLEYITDYELFFCEICEALDTLEQNK